MERVACVYVCACVFYFSVCVVLPGTAVHGKKKCLAANAAAVNHGPTFPFGQRHTKHS